MPPLSRFFLIACCMVCLQAPAKNLAGGSITEKSATATSLPIDTRIAADTDSANAECLAAEFIVWVHAADVQRWLHDYNAHSSLADVKALDAAWPRLATDSREIQAVLQHPAAAALRAFQNHYSVLGESFLIGADGGLVAATDRTSDYWQGDEAQFFDTVLLPNGKFKLFTAGVDESAHAMLAKLAIPIYNNNDDNHDDKPIGVLILGFDQVVVDFERPCE